jgi:hypothetical protein
MALEPFSRRFVQDTVYILHLDSEFYATMIIIYLSQRDRGPGLGKSLFLSTKTDFSRLDHRKFDPRKLAEVVVVGVVIDMHA